MKITRSACMLAAALTVTAGFPILSARAEIADGKAFAEARCGACHAIGADDTSRLEKAPAFRDLHKRYPVDTLAEAFAEGIVTGHPGMPEFVLDTDMIEDLLGYIKSLPQS